MFSQTLYAHLNTEVNYEEVLGDQSMPFRPKTENSYCYWNHGLRTRIHRLFQKSCSLIPVCICLVVMNNLDLFFLSKMIQGLFIFFFHCVFNKEVRKHLKNTLTGKKPLPDDSTATRATLLTVRKKHWGKNILLLLPKYTFIGGLSIVKQIVWLISVTHTKITDGLSQKFWLLF